jgi:6-phosphogluconolactonase
LKDGTLTRLVGRLFVAERQASSVQRQAGKGEREIVVLANPEALSQEAAARFAAAAQAAVAGSGRFTVALAGGSTPKRLYEILGADPYGRRLPWGQTHVFWGDERAVPPEHPDSNFGMARAALLCRAPVPAGQIHRMAAERTDRDAAAREYADAVARTFGVPPDGDPPALDLVLLGMGADGHTASLFPHTEALRETRRWVVRNPVPKLKTDRMTMTFPLLNRASMVLFLIAGKDKAAVLQEVLEGPSDPERLPSQAIRPASGLLIWLVDEAAAAKRSRREGQA